MGNPPAVSGLPARVQAGKAEGQREDTFPEDRPQRDAAAFVFVGDLRSKPRETISAAVLALRALRESGTAL